MPKNYAIISNNDLYEKYPKVHEFALQSFSDTVTEDTYPQVEAWEVQIGTAFVEGERVDDWPVAVVRPIFAGEGS